MATDPHPNVRTLLYPSRPARASPSARAQTRAWHAAPRSVAARRYVKDGQCGAHLCFRLPHHRHRRHGAIQRHAALSLRTAWLRRRCRSQHAGAIRHSDSLPPNRRSLHKAQPGRGLHVRILRCQPKPRRDLFRLDRPRLHHARPGDNLRRLGGEHVPADDRLLAVCVDLLCARRADLWFLFGKPVPRGHFP